MDTKAWEKYHEITDLIDSEVEGAILASGQKKVYVDYSAYDFEDEEHDIPRNNLHEIAVKGKVILFGEGDEFWGGEKAKDYYSPVLENPTWLEVCVHANRMIKRTRDRHHVFLEGLEKTKRKRGGVPIYEFSMGS